LDENYLHVSSLVIEYIGQIYWPSILSLTVPQKARVLDWQKKICRFGLLVKYPVDKLPGKLYFEES